MFFKDIIVFVWRGGSVYLVCYTFGGISKIIRIGVVIIMFIRVGIEFCGLKI